MRAAVLLLSLLIVASGCVAPASVQEVAAQDPVLVDDQGVLDGTLAQEWTWEVLPGFRAFRVCVAWEGSDTEPAVLLPRVQLRHDHAKGFEVTGRSEFAAATGAGCWFGHDQGAPGLWTLRLHAEGGRAQWSVEIDVLY